MEKTYDPNLIEEKNYQFWESEGFFKPTGEGQPYCIMIPPPNVTGVLHMGHGFQSSLQDALIRYHRMRGHNTLWQPGTDHAGIATQMVVERQLAATNQTRHELGREKFINRIWEWKEKSGGHITQQFRRLGVSVDWSRECFTMDDERSQAVKNAFLKLYEDGLIYRGKRLVNWDPKLQTAISDLEVVSEEKQGQLWHIRYPIADGSGHVTIATTRPETLLGDAAVAVHPDDERYQSLIGKELQLPLCDRTIPVIADHYVDPEFGSGCVKITPAHDFNDYAVGQRHKLPLINILTPDGHINNEAPAAYQTLNRFVARKKILADLEELGLLEKTEPHTLKIPRGDRTGEVIEPYLTDQWFVKMAPLAQPAIDAVKNGDVRIIPNNWEKTYFQWLDNIEDWCISRQLWWGHRIPAWYDDAGNHYVGENEAAVRKQHGLDESVALKQDEDVLDTWFSSALWPFATLGWPEKTEALQTFYPGSVLVTGFDILFFWVARMVMMGLKFMGDVPFKDVYITPLIRDAEGQKMSKSKGNALDPLDLIDGIDLEALVQKNTQALMQPEKAEKIERATRKQFPKGIPAFGTDALRFTFCALASPGRDVSFDLNRIGGYRNFCNKIWNAARYVSLQTDGLPCTPASDIKPRTVADRWILSQLHRTAEQAKLHFENYRLDLLCHVLYDFTWHAFCDWYLEFTKPILSDENANEAQQANTRGLLLHVLEQLTCLLHPVMPYLTEAIWQRVAPLAGIEGKTIMLQPYPMSDAAYIHADSETEIAWLQAVITGVRTIRGEMNISPKQPLTLCLKQITCNDQARLQDNEHYLKSLANLSEIVTTGDQDGDMATFLVDNMECLIPLAGLVDTQAEADRLKKEIAKLRKDLERSEAKLANPNFKDKAPEAVVAEELRRCDAFKAAIQKLEEKL